MKLNKAFFVLLFLAATTFLAANAGGGAGAEKDGLVVLSADNLLVLADEVNDESVGKTINQARKADYNKNQLHFSAKKAPLYLFLNTPGGSIQSGLELLEALQGLQRPIHTVSLFSASMGFQLVQSLGDRLILRNGILMSHNAYGQFSGSFGGVLPQQFDSRYNLWLSRMTALDTQTVKRTKGKQTLESYQKAYDHELWLDGAKAVSEGYADRIVQVKCDESLDGVNENIVYFFGLKIAYDTDKCPLNNSPTNIRIVKPVKDDDKEKEKEKGKEGEKGKEKEKEKEKKKDGEAFDESFVTIRAKFLEDYFQKHRAVVPMRW